VTARSTPAQIDQIVQVGGRAIRHHGQNAQIVAVVEDFAQFIGKAHIGAVDEAAGDAHGPGILTLLYGCVAATLLK
jgi:hypothetical protein